MSEKLIHPTAIIAEGAKLASDVRVGAYSIIGPQVEIGEGTVVQSHVIIEGNTKIGKNNQFFPFCSIGMPPQDLSYKGEDTKTLIGDNNVLREYVSVHRATTKENFITSIGNNNLLMAKVHIAHDAIVGSYCIMVNDVNLAGHVKVADRVRISGNTGIGQFIRLGRGSFIGGASAIDKDIPPFCTAYGNRVKLKGINIIGMRRQGFEKNVISEVVDFLRAMESSVLSAPSFVHNKELMNEFGTNEVVLEIAEFIRTSQVGVAPFVS